jgi:glycosyltransferase involved in cell wall biosynthesis
VNAHRPLVLVANARMPSERAQSLQVAQCAAAYERAGAPTTLLYARRRRTPALPPGKDLWDYYEVREGKRPVARPVDCVDWIDRVPRVLQYAPARLQEQSFARHAARIVRREFDGARALSREIECALALSRAGRSDVFLEIHRVPGGRLRKKWLLESARAVRGIVAISAGVREDLIALGVDAAKVRVEHDGFEPSRFANRPAKAEARATLGLPREVPLAVYTGGLLEWKGVEVLVDAARALPSVYFVIAGGMGADVKRLRARAGGLANVRIDGFQPPARVPLYLAAGDLAVVPNRSKPAISARHTSPLKVFEAMAAGIPLVASDLPSLREILVGGENALLVAPDDAAALAQGVDRLASDEVLRAKLGRALGSRAAEFTWDARARRILDWMEAAG